MNTYHKIQTVYLRDPDTNFKTLLDGAYAKPEFEYLAKNPWECTEKIDGTNIRVMWDGSEVSFNGKTDNAQMHRDLYVHLQNTFTAEKMAAQFGTEPTQVCMYGEGYGAGIQKGGFYRPDKAFILFDVWISDVWLERSSIEDIAASLECPIVPIVHQCTLPEAVEIVREGFNSIHAQGTDVAEGLIMKPLTPLFNRRGERVITKLKYKDFPR